MDFITFKEKFSSLMFKIIQIFEMIVAIFKYPTRGTEYDQALVKQYHLRLEQEYEIERIEMSQGRTDIYLKNMQVAFNSVHFTFKDR